VKDKFLILSFPVNQVITDNNEAKALIKSSNLKSETNQEIYLEAEMDTATDGRVSFAETEGINRVRTSLPYESVSTMNNVNESVRMSGLNEIDEIKKQIEEIKRDIQNYEMENNKLNIQQTNLASNSLLYRTKNKGMLIYKIIKNLALADKTNVKTEGSNQIPLTFVILLMTLGLTLGAYINRFTLNK
jgi:hypothetical protein